MTAPATAEGISPGGPVSDRSEVPGAVRAFLRLVAFEHSIFALPFVYLAALTAMAGDVRWADLALITVAMVGARTFAMAANRVIDRELDARNPRTAQRELVTGVVSMRTAYVGGFVALAVFVGAAALLSPLCAALAPVAVVPLVGYPYGKRFTWLCHAILGLAQAVAPVGAWIAVTDAWSWRAVVLGLAVGTWIGGFDLIYACQDAESDRSEGVHSVPARFGVPAALVTSGVTHVVTVALLVWWGVLVDAGAWWWAGVALAAAAMVYEHRIVRPTDLSRVNRAFFTVNGWVGVGLFVLGAIDIAVRT